MMVHLKVIWSVSVGFFYTKAVSIRFDEAATELVC